MNRSEFLAVLAAACSPRQEQQPEPARLTSRPGRQRRPIGPGLHQLGLHPQRDGVILVPASHRPGNPAPLMLALHGAGGSHEGPLDAIRPWAEERGFVLVSVDSRGPTWDAIRGGYGPDVQYIDLALAVVFAQVAIDMRRITVEGFSDGASYALGLGLANGDLFSKILAFSPGFIPPGAGATGAPAIFISHGTDDRILPIGQTSRRLVPMLRQAGRNVTYFEFEGGHGVAPEAASRAIDWMMDDR